MNREYGRSWLPFPTLRGDLAYTGKLAGGYLLI
jgi:hypothetical protein